MIHRHAAAYGYCRRESICWNIHYKRFDRSYGSDVSVLSAWNHVDNHGSRQLQNRRPTCDLVIWRFPSGSTQDSIHTTILMIINLLKIGTWRLWFSRPSSCKAAWESSRRRRSSTALNFNRSTSVSHWLQLLCKASFSSSANVSRVSSSDSTKLEMWKEIRTDLSEE